MKKQFEGMDALFHKTEATKEKEILINESQNNKLNNLYVKKTFLIDEQIYEKLQILSFKEKKTQKEIINTLLKTYIDDFEIKNGSLNR